MKKILFLIISLALTALVSTAADKGAEISFKSTSHDFGTIKSDGGIVTATYEYTNTGTAPLVIVSVSRGGCGCTTPTFAKEPLAPGGTGIITVQFNPQGRRGEFNREVKVRTNADKKRIGLKFSGVIVP